MAYLALGAAALLGGAYLACSAAELVLWLSQVNGRK